MFPRGLKKVSHVHKLMNLLTSQSADGWVSRKLKKALSVFLKLLVYESKICK
jgi:hypothetical protein